MTFVMSNHFVSDLFDDEFVEALNTQDESCIDQAAAQGELDYWLKQHFTHANPVAKQAIANIRNFFIEGGTL